jgi:hypothetical protein
MSNQVIDYKTLIPYKLIDIIQLIMNNKKKSFFEALHYLYGSKLYNALSNETTKIWHLSHYKLFDMLETEKQNRVLEFPDFI